MTHNHLHISASPSLKISQFGPIVEINWTYLMQTRCEVIQSNDDVPAYLLMPEVIGLIDSELHNTKRLVIEMMFILGCRVSELLLLTPRHFVFDGQNSYVNMPTLKRRIAGTGKRKRKRLNEADELGKLPLRQVPITDQQFIARIQSYIVSERLSTSRRFFAVTRRTINRWIENTVETYESKYGPTQVNITPHTFRHSFAINAILHFTPLKILQNWLGHENQSSTEIYTKVLFSDSFEFAKRIAWRPTIQLNEKTT